MPQVEAAEFTSGIQPRTGAMLGQFEAEGQKPQEAPYFPQSGQAAIISKLQRFPCVRGVCLAMRIQRSVPES